MQMDFKPPGQFDKLAELTRSLTYGEMIDLALGLWKAAGGAEITAETFPAILGRWAKEHGETLAPTGHLGLNNCRRTAQAPSERR